MKDIYYVFKEKQSSKQADFFIPRLPNILN